MANPSRTTCPKQQAVPYVFWILIVLGVAGCSGEPPRVPSDQAASPQTAAAAATEAGIVKIWSVADRTLLQSLTLDGQPHSPIMLIAQAEPLVVLVFFLFFVTLSVGILWSFLRLFGPWMQALMSGVHVSVFDIIGMRLRKVDPKTVVRALIMAQQAGAPLATAEVESAYLQGVDVEKVVLAYIRAKRDGIQITFQELVDADLDNRLKEKLEGR